MSPGTFYGGISVADIQADNYRTSLRNKQIATIFKELKLIEKYGSGVRRVIETFVAYGLPAPVYEATQGGMAVTVFKAIDETTANKTDGGVSEGVSELLEAIKRHPGMRVPALAEKMQTSAKNLERWLKQLKENGQIEFRGAAKTGGYYYLDADQ